MFSKLNEFSLNLPLAGDFSRRLISSLRGAAGSLRDAAGAPRQLPPS